MAARRRPARVCIDQVLPSELFLPQRLVVPRRGRARAIAPIGKTWMNGSTLRVRFLGGNNAQRALAREQAAWWSQTANLSFVFDDSPQAEIRISFDSTDGAWSYVGTDARGIPASQATMNLGFTDGGTAAHEFGHAIGLSHEHQNPAGGIQWNEPVVIRELAGPPNFWDEATVRHNVLDKYSVDQIKGTRFDPDSIMLYFFPASWTRNGIATSANEVLSATDKSFVASAAMYPRTGPVVDDATELTVNARSRTRAEIGAFGEEDLFTFTAEASGRYVVDTRGSSDLVMKLFGPDSPTALVAEDDDSGYGLNARIARPLTPGRYWIQIRHADTTGGTGDYTVRVRRV
jgi:hypothetical protein